jgi:hypothetical protein
MTRPQCRRGDVGLCRVSHLERSRACACRWEIENPAQPYITTAALRWRSVRMTEPEELPNADGKYARRSAHTIVPLY